MASEILLLLLLAVTVTASSYRRCTNLGNLPLQNNKRLTHHTFLSIQMTGLMSCARACANRGRCKSFNFLLGFGTCELNQANYAETGTITVETSWVYYDIEGFPQSVRQQCKDVSCGYNETCEISSSLQPYCNTCSIETGCGVCYPISEVTGRWYRSYGCFKSTPGKVLPELHVNLRSSIVWPNLKKTIDACASASASTNREFFGIQFYGECYIGNATEANFLTPVTINECATACPNAVGDGSSTQVYQWI
ncbi:uncharacterized protein LOC124261930 [Haliotis rubra]|uniref:uncharacterized protein LOC124261930 n=1 Tax=Haliotis rubra TaxID=36100 RepID=UPI001EE5B720|nr:uncharacterized protein LOC124261930 [Haliotis rubra]XP_046552255.1 uncharacterized protein LOC124261930 [Haliotis rubra]